MAFISLVPFKIDFTVDGTPTAIDGGIIQEGTLYQRTLQIKDAGGSPIDCSEFGAAAPRCDFRTGVIDSPDNGVTTNCPQPTVAWSNAANGTILFQMPMSVWTSWSAAAARVSSGVHQIELIHSTGARTRAFYGTWAISKEVTA